MQRILTRDSVEFFKRIFGPLQTLENSQVVYSVNLHGSSNGNNNSLKVILKNEHTPSFPIDWRMFSFLRTIATISIITGESLRKESSTSNFTTDFFGQSDLQALSNHISNNDRIEKRNDQLSNHSQELMKSFFILSRHLTSTDLRQIPLFQQKDRVKFVTITPQLKAFLHANNPSAEEQKNIDQFKGFLRENSIEITPEMLDLTTAINYLKPRLNLSTTETKSPIVLQQLPLTTPPPKKILVETGIASSSELLVSPTSPLDYLILSVYRGHLEESFIGESHPDIQDLSQRFHLHFKSQVFPAHKGTLEFYSFIRK